MASARRMFEGDDWSVVSRDGMPGRGLVEGNLSRCSADCLAR